MNEHSKPGPSMPDVAASPRTPRTYRKPKLKVYGDVSELTASGNGRTSPTTDPTAPPFCGQFPNYPGCRTS